MITLSPNAEVCPDADAARIVGRKQDRPAIPAIPTIHIPSRTLP
jgi:hypothetical protein